MSSGKTTKEETKTFLLGSLPSGTKLGLAFEVECAVDVSRFPKTETRIKLLNFAADNVKESTIE